MVEIRGDPEFQDIDPWLDNRGTAFNAASKGKHVPEIERQVCFNNEKLQGKLAQLPQKKLPKLMIARLVAECTQMVDGFPPKGGISDMISPCTSMTGI